MRFGDDEIRCLTFDLDDTLWLCAPVIHNAEFKFYAWLQTHYPVIADAYDLEALTLHRRQLFTEYPDMSHDFSWLRKRWLARLTEDFGSDSDLVEEGFRIYHTARNDVALFPGALEVLEQVSGAFQCGSITNGNADVAMVGIDHFFDFSITAAGAGASKPAPEIFEAAVDAADCTAREILHIGDDPDRDIRGAAAVGMRTAWVNPDGESWVGDDTPDLELRLIAELPDLIAQQA